MLGFLLGMSIGAIATGGLGGPWAGRGRATAIDAAARSDQGGHLAGEPVESSLEEVLEIAREALAHMHEHLDDYTATLIKQESINGALGEAHRMLVKVQCRHRGGNRDETEPFRVYLRFEHPPSVAGREVIWAEDMYNQKMVAHEGGLLGLVTVHLDPRGMVAMRGQRYPIYDIGLTNLVKKLIERGEQDLGNPDVTVTITHNWELEGQICDLIEVRRSRPSGREEDFSLAEIYFDRVRHLPLRYAAYGWPAGWTETADLSAAPLLESYTYFDIQTNVGLSESDFDFRNPRYQFR